MKKLNENDGKNLLKEIKRTSLASACGIAAMLLSALLFAALIYYGIVPFRAAKLCVAFCCFLGGIVASLLNGPKGKVMLYVPVMLWEMLAIIYVVGQLIFNGFFSLEQGFLTVAAMFIGLTAGAVASNLR